MKKRKYASGTKVKNYIETPNQALSKNALDMDISMIEGMTDPMANLLGMLGNAGMQVGTSMLGSKVPGIGGQLIKGASPFLQNLAQMAFGGSVPSVPVEIEGNEVGEMPNGKVFEAKGPSHENGGIDVSLPEGTEMYSKRIKVDGVSMADRKKKRNKRQVSLEELLNKNATDKLLKNSLERTIETNTTEEEADTKIQETVKSLLNPENQGFAYGGGVKTLPKYGLGDTVNMDSFMENEAMRLEDQRMASLMPGVTMDSFMEDEAIRIEDQRMASLMPEVQPLPMDFNIGDALGMAGTAFSTFAPMQNTKNMRAGDTPNINAFEGFGNDALAALESSKEQVQGQTANALKDVNLSSASQTRKNRNSARGINQMRALDLVTNLQDKQVKADINMKASEILQTIFGQQAQLENQQDQTVMQGEQNRDGADREDRDNFFSQLSGDIATKGQGMQQMGKMFNEAKSNKISEEAINSMSKFGFNWKNGVLYDSNNNPSTEAQRQKLATSNGYSNYTEYKKAMGL
jgi:hypothetical protein